MSSRLPPHLSTLSSLLFEKLVRLYPLSYRERYETEMERTFRDCCQSAFSARGYAGLLSLCTATSLDLITEAARKHREYGISEVGRRRLRLASLLALGLGLVGVLTPYGAIRGVLVAPTLAGLGVAGLSLSGPAKSVGEVRSGIAPEPHLQGAQISLLVAACFAGLFLASRFSVASEAELLRLGGPLGYLSMAASHLGFFGLGLWLTRRGSVWALALVLPISGGWIVFRAADVWAIVSGQFAGDGWRLVLSLGSFASAALACAASLRAVPALRATKANTVQ